MSKRKLAFDLAKLFALLAVILGHTSVYGVPWPLVSATYSFSLPLFFIVSGYFMKNTPIENAEDAKARVLSAVKTCIVPYVITVVIVLVFNICYQLIFHQESMLHSSIFWLKGAMYGTGVQRTNTLIPNVGSIGAIWFLLALFWMRLIFAFTARFKYQGVLIVILFIIGYTTTNYVFLPWSIQPGLCAALFAYVGLMIKKYDIMSKLDNVLLLAIVAVIGIYNLLYQGNFYMVANEFGDGVLQDTIGSCATSILILKAFMFFEDRGYPKSVHKLAAIGKYTLPLFCMHLVELNIIDYPMVLSRLHITIANEWILIFITRMGIIALLSFVIYIYPFTSQIYYRTSGRKRRDA